MIPEGRLPYDESDEREPLPPLHELLLTTPLYESLKISRGNAADIAGIVYFSDSLDAHCVDCDQMSVFRANNRGTALPLTNKDVGELLSNHHISLYLYCSRDYQHSLRVYFRIQDYTITKIGQYPSIASLLSANTEKYRAVLGKKYTEFTRAIGLASHGVGIGSFVYLRRIFEDLIEDAHQSVIKSGNWSADDFATLRMDEKILSLRDYLPSFLVENRSVYSILSKGIHSLDEKECLQYFDVLRGAIELMLDEKHERKEREKKQNNISKLLSDIRGKIG